MQRTPFIVSGYTLHWLNDMNGWGFAVLDTPPLRHVELRCEIKNGGLNQLAMILDGVLRHRHSLEVGTDARGISALGPHCGRSSAAQRSPRGGCCRAACVVLGHSSTVRHRGTRHSVYLNTSLLSFPFLFFLGWKMENYIHSLFFFFWCMLYRAFSL